MLRIKGSWGRPVPLISEIENEIVIVALEESRGQVFDSYNKR